MARPLRILFPDAHYHVTCRGNERKAIFRDETDRSVFLDKLKASRQIYGVEIHAYVLMNNHFHLIVETPKGNLSEFMRHFNISYTAAFNRRHHRVGHLYQGRYKAIVIDKDRYLLELSRYVHVNPVRVRSYRTKNIHEQIRYLQSYPWSSLSGYLYSQSTQSWINYDTVLSYVGGSRKRYGEFLAEGIQKGYSTPWAKLQGQVVLGEGDFVERVKKKIKAGGSRREQPAIRRFEGKKLKVVLRAVAGYFGLAEEKLTGRRTGHRNERAVAMELMYRYGGVRQAEIGKLLGNLDYTAVSRERKRLRDKAQEEKALKAALEEIETSLMYR
jgi:REP element-mobilizing transposase RayT